MLKKIEKVLEERVRPQLSAHEGNVEIAGFDDGILKIRLTGRCSGCPSAKLTTEEMIGRIIHEELPEVKDTILISETGQELLDFAKKLLNHQI